MALAIAAPKPSVAASSAKSSVKLLSMSHYTKFNSTKNISQLSRDIKRWGLELGFNQIGITDTHLQTAETEHQAWIKKGFHGEMDYMAKHGTKRTRPAELV